MLQFKDIELSDKAWVDELLSISDFPGCEYTFGNNYIWKDIFNIKIARFEDFYICRQDNCFIFPAGKGNVAALIDELKNVCENENIPLIFNSMDKSSASTLEKNFPGKFRFSSNEDLFDYIYTSESLSSLSGKKLHSKRNFINRFKTFNWSFEEINESNIDECKKMSLEWCKYNNCDADDEKAEEMCAVKIGLDNFFDLGFQGLILKVDNRTVAFSYGEKVNSNTFDVHVEKAFSDVVGAYPMINYLMSNHFGKNYIYINREEDMGEENLRKAKRSYKPCFMIEKFRAELIEN